MFDPAVFFNNIPFYIDVQRTKLKHYTIQNSDQILTHVIHNM